METDVAILNFLNRDNDSLHVFASKLQIPSDSAPLLVKKPLLSSNRPLELENNDFSSSESQRILEEYKMEKDIMYQCEAKLLISDPGNEDCQRQIIQHSTSDEDDDLESVPLPPSQYSNNIIELSESTLQVDNFVDDLFQSDYIPSGCRQPEEEFTNFVENKEMQLVDEPSNSKTSLLPSDVNMLLYETDSDDCEEIQGGLFTNSIEILDDHGELCQVNGYSLNLPLSAMGIQATYDSDITIKSDADIFIAHYIQSYISKSQKSEEGGFEEFLLDEHLNLLDADVENEEEKCSGVEKEGSEFLPTRLQRIMEEYEARPPGPFGIDEIEEIPDISRSFEDIVFLE